MSDIDVHVPNTMTTKVVASVTAAVLTSAIIGTFAILWTMNERLTMLHVQQLSIESNFSMIRTDINDIKSRLRTLEVTNAVNASDREKD